MGLGRGWYGVVPQSLLHAPAAPLMYLQMYLQTKTRRCPGCQTPTFKDGGCLHVKCTICK